MRSSIKAAYEEAMAKKSKRPQHETSSPHGSLVHPSFPQPGGVNPSFMGSMSSAPGQGPPPSASMGLPNGLTGEEQGAGAGF